MAVAADNNSTFTDYAHPERLVSTEWLAGQLADRPDGSDRSHNLVVIESDEDVLLYDTGHIHPCGRGGWWRS